MEHMILYKRGFNFLIKDNRNGPFRKLSCNARDVIWWTVQVEKSANVKAFPND